MLRIFPGIPRIPHLAVAIIRRLTIGPVIWPLLDLRFREVHLWVLFLEFPNFVVRIDSKEADIEMNNKMGPRARLWQEVPHGVEKHSYVRASLYLSISIFFSSSLVGLPSSFCRWSYIIFSTIPRVSPSKSAFERQPR